MEPFDSPSNRFNSVTMMKSRELLSTNLSSGSFPQRSHIWWCFPFLMVGRQILRSKDMHSPVVVLFFQPVDFQSVAIICSHQIQWQKPSRAEVCTYLLVRIKSLTSVSVINTHWWSILLAFSSGIFLSLSIGVITVTSSQLRGSLIRATDMTSHHPLSLRLIGPKMES